MQPYLGSCQASTVEMVVKIVDGFCCDYNICDTPLLALGEVSVSYEDRYI